MGIEAPETSVSCRSELARDGVRSDEVDRLTQRRSQPSAAPTDSAFAAPPVGAHEHREAAMAMYQTDRYRGLAVLVRSYRKHSNSDGYLI